MNAKRPFAIVCNERGAYRIRRDGITYIESISDADQMFAKIKSVSKNSSYSNFNSIIDYDREQSQGFCDCFPLTTTSFCCGLCGGQRFIDTY